MIEGINILAVEEVVTEYNINWVGIIITVCVLAVGCLGLYFKLKEDDYCEYIRFEDIVLVWIVLSFLSVFIWTLCAPPEEYENQYKVTISEEVNFVEFNDKYEVIDQEGRIFTISEKEMQSK